MCILEYIKSEYSAWFFLYSKGTSKLYFPMLVTHVHVDSFPNWDTVAPVTGHPGCLSHHSREVSFPWKYFSCVLQMRHCLFCCPFYFVWVYFQSGTYPLTNSLNQLVWDLAEDIFYFQNPDIWIGISDKYKCINFSATRTSPAPRRRPGLVTTQSGVVTNWLLSSSVSPHLVPGHAEKTIILRWKYFKGQLKSSK